MKRIGFALAAFAVCLSPFSTKADAERGKALYEQRCISCHGVAGAGDGPIALNLPETMKPRNLQNKAGYKFATDDQKLGQIIKEGGAAHGLQALMPPQADLNDADLKSLVEHVKSLQK